MSDLVRNPENMVFLHEGHIMFDVELKNTRLTEDEMVKNQTFMH